MNRTPQASRRIWLAIAAILALPHPSPAQVRVLISGGFFAPLQELRPDFEKATGITVTPIRGQSQGNGPNTIAAQLRNGVAADVVIMSREGLDELIGEGKITAGSDVNLAQTPLGVAVRAGAPRPDISTVEAFKQTLLRARSITFPASTTGIYMMTKLFPRLGIFNEISGKITHDGVASVASGSAELAIQPVSELLHIPGTDFVGTIPADTQYVSVFAAAMVAGSKQSEASKRLIAFLTTGNAMAVIKKSGMEPVVRH
jgi:molybdate transport system substrate-binding protein